MPASSSPPPPPPPPRPSLLALLLAKLRDPRVLGAALEMAGKAFLADDAQDIGIGRFTREDRPWHVDTAPGLHAGRPGDHPSSAHHWQLGWLLDVAGRVLQKTGGQK